MSGDHRHSSGMEIVLLNLCLAVRNFRHFVPYTPDFGTHLVVLGWAGWAVVCPSTPDPRFLAD